MKKAVFWWALFFIYCVLIFFLSSRPIYFFNETNILFFDKILHIVEYAVFSFLLLRAIKYSLGTFNIKFIYFIVITCAIIYGMTDELHQAFVLGRTASISDLGADFVGSLIGIFI